MHIYILYLINILVCIVVGTGLRCRPDAYPSSPHPYAPPLYPPQVAQTCVDWLIHKTGNIHADFVRMRTSSPPLPSPYPRTIFPALAIPTHSPFAPSLIPNS